MRATLAALRMMGCASAVTTVRTAASIDRVGHEGAKFMTYYAEQSCTAGRTVTA
ncbi:MAG: hypothetical protein WA863_02620 [Methyloceanibacter sp.]